VRLVFSFALPGVLRAPQDPGSLIPLIRPADFERLKAEGVVSGGMLPKLENAFAALRAGVSQVIICQAGAIASLGEPHFQGTRIEA
jgi:acetylglutamate kinase